MQGWVKQHSSTPLKDNWSTVRRLTDTKPIRTLAGSAHLNYLELQTNWSWAGCVVSERKSHRTEKEGAVMVPCGTGPCHSLKA